MIPALGIAAFDATSPLAPWRFTRRPPGPRDVQIQILFCGICHSDLHTVHGDWGPVAYPQVPGHEIVGRVVATGADVTRWREGDVVGVGCIVDSCRTCPSCEEGLEQYCEEGMTDTYASPDRNTGLPTQGGYADVIVVDDRFVLRIPASLDPARAAPLLCAGITTYAPLRHWRVGPGSRVGVVGIGGLGHMAVKMAAAMGAHVVVLTTSPDKVADARRLGAHDVVLSTDRDAMTAQKNSLDLILDTVSASHDLRPAFALLRRDGALCLLGASPEPHRAPSTSSFIMKRKSLTGSLLGGIPETQEMLDFCAAHRIEADIELIPALAVNEAYARLLKSDVKYRFVIDLDTLHG
ncbi:MAG: NAD(P)-dependent alcohol dehydrogenase [Gemmatimonadota bacterium]|nr:NAD(P)-dependent alcohol dehydrogenase [Gemmatimonadota bacterium]